MNAQSMEKLYTNKANAYLIISDLHKRSKNKSHRINYPNEIKFVEKEISKLAKKYKTNGYNVIALFLGDIFDSSENVGDDAMKSLGSFKYLLKEFTEVYVCVGNHEFTYSKNNPFWHLLKTLNSNRILESNNKRFWLPKGDMNYIDVIDKIEDGEVEFIFNHYGTGIALPSIDKISIGLFHQDLVIKDALEKSKSKNLKVLDLGEEYNKSKLGYMYLDDNNILRNYQYSFIGHNHMIYGSWKDDSEFNTCEINYLASLGRTNVNEVQDNFLERDIPCIITQEGKFVRKESNFIYLPNRKECVDEISLLKYKEKREKQKVTNNLINNELKINSSPIKNIKCIFSSEMIDEIIDSVLEERRDIFLDSFRERISKIKIM